MTFRDLRDYCLSKPGARETFPFGEAVLVFKVSGKMFALTNVDDPVLTVSLKCEPDRALELRDRYPAVQPGYHLSKAHWNTVALDGGEIPETEIRGWIDESYDLVVQGLKRAERERLAGQHVDPEGTDGPSGVLELETRE